MADQPYLAKNILIKKPSYPEADCLFVLKQTSCLEMWNSLKSEVKKNFFSFFLHCMPDPLHLYLYFFCYYLGKIGNCF